jgi:hypothetical protein
MTMTSALCRTMTSVAILVVIASEACAISGTAIIATKGQPVPASAAWPAGVAAIVNDSTRTTGWNSWFSEWPNDVNQYAFEIKGTEDVNRLIEKLAATKADLRQIRLSYLPEPSGLGWVTQLPKGNGIAAVFSIGDQGRIDEWFKTVRKPFGVMEFTAAPVAVPPTLTIFVQHKLVDLNKLTIPKGMTVTSGYVPTVFHRSNTKQEEAEAAQKQNTPSVPPNLDPAAQAVADRIAAFLKTRNSKK